MEHLGAHSPLSRHNECYNRTLVLRNDGWGRVGNLHRPGEVCFLTDIATFGVAQRLINLIRYRLCEEENMAHDESLYSFLSDNCIQCDLLHKRCLHNV